VKVICPFDLEIELTVSLDCCPFEIPSEDRAKKAYSDVASALGLVEDARLALARDRAEFGSGSRAVGLDEAHLRGEAGRADVRRFIGKAEMGQDFLDR
jgi:hypothetical protein